MLKEQILQKSIVSKVIDENELNEFLKRSVTFLNDVSELPEAGIEYYEQVYNVAGVIYVCEEVLTSIFEWVTYDTSGQDINYLDAYNKPTINGVVIVGDMTLKDIGLPVGNVKLDNVAVSTWGASAEYGSYEFESVIEVIGVTAHDIAFVIFGVDESDSGNYASVTATGTDYVKIYSKVDTAITIPTIEIHKY